MITTKLYIPTTTPSHQIWDLRASNLKGKTLIAFHVMADFQRLKCLLLGKTHQSLTGETRQCVHDFSAK